MATIEELEKTREFFRNDRYATETGAVIDEIDDHYSKCSLVLNEHHRNGVGGIMGGVYFTLADFAFAVASKQPRTFSLFSTTLRNMATLPPRVMMPSSSKADRRDKYISLTPASIKTHCEIRIMSFLSFVPIA